MGSYQFCNLNVDLKIIYFKYISKKNYDPISTSLGFQSFPVQPSNRGNRPYIFRLDPEKRSFSTGSTRKKQPGCPSFDLYTKFLDICLHRLTKTTLFYFVKNARQGHPIFWTPNIELINLDEMKNFGKESIQSAQIDSTGEIRWTRQFRATVSCVVGVKGI